MVVWRLAIRDAPDRSTRNKVNGSDLRGLLHTEQDPLCVPAQLCVWAFITQTTVINSLYRKRPIASRVQQA